MKSRLALISLILALFLNVLPFALMGIAYLSGKTGYDVAGYSWFLLFSIPVGAVLLIIMIVVEVTTRVRRAVKK